jgi:hypothetical protein
MSLSGELRAGLLFALVACGVLGCEHPHYVIRNPDGGVIAIAEDTPELRARAERLMHEHLPGGYVIDAVRTVPLGSPYQTVTQAGPFAEVEVHQRHEVMLYYHAPRPEAVVPARYNPPPAASATTSARPAQEAPSAVQGPDLPAQPVPVGN